MAKDFKGHLEASDPRNVLWGAGGCAWPTFPPYRLRLGVENPPAKWAFLRTDGVLFEATEATTHDVVIWQAIAGLPECFQFWRITRTYERGAENWHWLLEIQTDCTEEPWEITDETPIGKGNVDVQLEHVGWDPEQVPSPGTPLYLIQVYFNETAPLDSWPPWE
jgi:hypothetical protein